MIDDGDIYWADKRNIDDLNQARKEESFELTEIKDIEKHKKNNDNSVIEKAIILKKSIILISLSILYGSSK